MSELNVADEPSRAIAAWKSLGWERWWNDFEKEVDYRPTQPGPFSHSQRKPPTESAEKAEGQPEEIAEVHQMEDSGGALCSERSRARLVPGRVHERDVRAWGGDRHRREDSRCSEILLPRPRPSLNRNAPTKHPSPERGGWQPRRLRPQQRLPLPIEALGVIMMELIVKGKPQLAVRLFVSSTWRVLDSESKAAIVPPQIGGGGRFQNCAILLHPTEDGMPGKTGVFDATVVIDSDPWISQHLASLIQGKQPNDSLWSDPHHVLITNYRKVTEMLGLQSLGSCLYTLRHGGATHDIVTRRRSTLEVKQRGR